MSYINAKEFALANLGKTMRYVHPYSDLEGMLVGYNEKNNYIYISLTRSDIG